jgi:hypothetical protein
MEPLHDYATLAGWRRDFEKTIYRTLLHFNHKYDAGIVIKDESHRPIAERLREEHLTLSEKGIVPIVLLSTARPDRKAIHTDNLWEYRNEDFRYFGLSSLSRSGEWKHRFPKIVPRGLHALPGNDSPVQYFPVLEF